MKYAYLFHLLVWIMPFLLFQWAIGHHKLRPNLRAIIPTTLIAGTWYSISDYVAIREGIWHFDEEQILGIKLGPIPLEEILFFFLTALLVAQSVVLILPKRLRWGH